MAILNASKRRRLTDEEQGQLDDLLDLPSSEGELSDWELDFIDSLHKQRDDRLSKDQLQKLKEIVDKYL